MSHKPGIAARPLDVALTTLLVDSGQDEADSLAIEGLALLAAHRLGGSLPAETIERLRTAAMPRVMHTMMQEASGWAVSRTLREAGISHAILKGPTLAEVWTEAYGVDARVYNDIDVLVEARQAADAERLFIELLGARQLTESAGERGLMLPTGGVIDLHWLLLNDRDIARRHRFDTAQLLERADRSAVFPRLAFEDRVVHVCLHAIVSDASQLCAVLDVAALLAAPEADLDSIEACAREHRAVLPLAVMVDRVVGLTELPAASALARRLPQSLWRSACRSLIRSNEPTTGRHWTGGEFLRATRATNTGSLASLVGRAPTNLRTQWSLRRQIAQADAPSPMLISLEPWDEVWRRNQHLVRELMRQGLTRSIIFVEPPSFNLRSTIAHPLPEVTVVRPPLILPRRVGGLWLTSRWLRVLWLRNVDVLWINDPSLGVHCLDGRRRAVYDVTDDWRCAEQPPRGLRRLVAAEDRLAVRASTVVCSPELARRWWARYRVAPAVVQNAATSRRVDGGGHVALAGKAPHVGYVGTLQQERLDIDLAREVAASPVVGTVHLLGPDALSIDARQHLRESSKIRVEPAVASEAVPAWLMSFDVLITPHVVSDFTLSLDAIKAFEYLATDRPVVSTPTSGFQDLPAVDGLTVVDRDGFVAAVEQALSVDMRYERSVATWAERAREFAECGLNVSPSRIPAR